MHIVLCTQEYPPETGQGGIGTQAHIKAHRLSAMGHQVHVLSHSVEDRRSDYMDGPVRITRILGMDHAAPVHSTLAHWLSYSARVAVALNEIHKRSPVDIVEFAEYGCEGLVHLTNQASWANIPAVIQLHGPLSMFGKEMNWPDVESEFYRLGVAMEGTCLRLADGIYSSSQTTANWCSAEYGLDGEAVPVIHTGVNTSVFCPDLAPKDDRPTVTFLGRVDEAKGIVDLVRASVILAGELPDLCLRIFGKVSEETRCQLHEIASEAGASELLDFAGFVAHARLATELCRSHVMALPSKYEPGPGFAYLETMACGVPVIGCGNAGAAEVIIDDVTGKLVEPGNISQLADALRVLLRDALGENAFGIRAREHIKQNFETADCVTKIEHFYRQIAQSAKAREWPGAVLADLPKTLAQGLAG